MKKILILFRSWLNFRKTCQDSQKITSVQNLKNIQNVTNYDQRSKSYKIWTITKKLQVLMKGKKLQILNNNKKVTYSDQRSKSYKIWTMTKMSQILNKSQILCSKLQRLKMLKLCTKLEMLKDLSKMCKLNRYASGSRCRFHLCKWKHFVVNCKKAILAPHPQEQQQHTYS